MAIIDNFSSSHTHTGTHNTITTDSTSVTTGGFGQIVHCQACGTYYTGAHTCTPNPPNFWDHQQTTILTDDMSPDMREVVRESIKEALDEWKELQIQEHYQNETFANFDIVLELISALIRSIEEQEFDAPDIMFHLRELQKLLDNIDGSE